MNSFKIAWRNFYKRKYYSIINVIGLALGIASATIIFLFLSFHLSFDKFHQNRNRIFRAVTELHLPDGSTEYDQGTPYILGELAKQQIAGIADKSTLLDKRSFTVGVIKNGEDNSTVFNEKENVAFTDNSWFRIFTYSWISGNANNALSEPYTAVITASLAKKYFNTIQAVGRTIKLDNKYLITVKGVLEDNPTNTDVQANLFLSIASVKPMYPDLKDFWNDIGFISSKNHVYFLLHEGVSPTLVDPQIKEVTRKPLVAYNGVYKFNLQPLDQVHFDSRYSGSISKSLLLILSSIGLALIGIACINFINMSTAQSLTRAKEIGTRKIWVAARLLYFGNL